MVCDVQAVLEANTEFAIDGNRGFVAEAHSGLDWSFVAAHKVGPLMAVEADAVTGAMRQAGNFVVRTEAGIGDHFARRRIDSFARCADLRRGKARILRFAFEVPDIALSLGRLAEDKRARDVGLITFNAAPSIHQNDIAFF